MSEKNYNYKIRRFTFDGKKYKVYGKTDSEAERKKAERLAELKRGEDTRGGNIPLKDWAETAFETYKPNISLDTYKQSLWRLKKHVLDDVGAYPVNRITSIQLQKIMNRQKGKSRSHISKLAQELYFVFDCARKNGMIVKNPAADLVRPTGAAGKRRALTERERACLLNVIPTDPRFVFFKLMLFCGCRPREAAGVKYEDVIYKNGFPFLHIRGTKTANSDRFVPITPEAEFLLEKKTGLVATNADGNPHTQQSYLHLVNALKRAMNINLGCKVYRNKLIPPLPLADDFVPYLLRHTYCTDLKKKGVDIRIAKQFLGHADIRTTANIYDHDDGETLILGAEQLGIKKRG